MRQWLRLSLPHKKTMAATSANEIDETRLVGKYNDE